MAPNNAVKIVLGDTKKSTTKLQGNKFCIKHIMRTKIMNRVCPREEYGDQINPFLTNGYAQGHLGIPT
jgi:hypothetical protein